MQTTTMAAHSVSADYLSAILNWGVSRLRRTDVWSFEGIPMPRPMRTGLRSGWESASSLWRIAALSEPTHATAHSHRSATIGSTFVARRAGK